MANLINIKMKKAALVFLSFLIAVTSFSAIATNANTQAYAITNDDVETTIVEVAGKRIYDEAYKVLSYINKERKAQGLAKLTIDSELTEYAMVRAAELTILYSHTRPNGGSLLGWNNNVYDYLGENIAGGQKTAKKVYTAWYNSAWHYAAMVDSVYKSVGIGCFKDTDGHYYWSLVLGFYDGDGEYSTKNKTVSQPVEIVVDYDYENDITMQRFWDEDCNCNHYWKRATVITAASKETKGKIKYKCTDCGKTKTVSVAKVKCATLSTKTYTYNGNAKKPTVTVYDTNGNIISSKYYTVTYISRATGKTVSSMTNVGKYYVKIKFKGNYSGTIKKKVTIKPKKTSWNYEASHSAKSGYIKIVWTKITSCTTGYQIQYSTSNSFKNATTKTIKNNTTTSITVKRLKVGKTHYFRMRTYKTVKVDGKSTKIYSDWIYDEWH